MSVDEFLQGQDAQVVCWLLSSLGAGTLTFFGSSRPLATGRNTPHFSVPTKILTGL